MKRKPTKRAASKPAKKAKKSAAKTRKDAVKRAPARGATSRAKPARSSAKASKSAPAAKAAPAAKVARPIKASSSTARSNGATGGKAPKTEEVLEHAHLENDDDTVLGLGGYDENEDLDESYTEEEDEFTDEPEETY